MSEYAFGSYPPSHATNAVVHYTRKASPGSLVTVVSRTDTHVTFRAFGDASVLPIRTFDEDFEPVLDAHIGTASILPAAAGQAEQDAARYRYLRDHCVTRWNSRISGSKTLSIDFDGVGHDLDAAVDAAMDGRS